MIIMLDLDGTLLKDDKTISDYTLNVLNKLKQDHIITFNTARGIREAKQYMDLIKPDYSVLNSGAAIYDKNHELIYHKGYTDSETREILKGLKEHTEVVIVETLKAPLSDIKGLVLEGLVPLYDDFTKDFGKVNVIVFDSGGKEDAVKLAKTFDSYLVKFLNSNCYQLSKTTKGTGLEVIKDLTKIDEVIAFGDDTGDLEMFKYASKPVKMKNSVPQVKEAKAEETKYTNDEDGVAKHLASLFQLEEIC